MEKDVVSSATDLGVAAAYAPAALPVSTNDVVFLSGTTYANASSLTLFAASAPMATLNDVNAAALTISGPANSANVNRTITLNGGSDTIGGSAPTDLIYLANGANLTLQNLPGSTNSLLVAVAASGDLDVGSNATLSINSTFSGAFNLKKTGAGTLTLSGANTVAGAGKTFELSAGKLNFNNGNALGNAATTVLIDGGTTIDNTSGAAVNIGIGLLWTINGDFTFAGGGSGTNHDLVLKSSPPMSLGTTPGASRTITVAATNSTLTIPCAVTNGTTASQLIKDGAGALMLSGSSTFTGGVTLAAGTLNLNEAGTSTNGVLGNGGPFIINGGTIDNTRNLSRILLNTNPITIGGNFAYSTAAGVAANNLTLPGTVSLAADHTLTLNGAGVLTLSGVLTNTGDSARTLTVNNGATATSFGALTLGGYALSGSGSTAARTNVINGNGVVTISGAVSDGVSAGCGLTYSGSGSLTLGGANTFGGLLSINAGTVTISGNNTGTGGAALNGGTLNINSIGVVLTNGPLGNGGTFTINGGTLDNSSGASRVVANVNPITIGGDFVYSTPAGTANNNLTLPGNG